MKSLTSYAYKTLTALMIVMLALTATPVSPALAASTGLASPTACTSGGGEWATPTNALTSNDQRTTANNDGEDMTCTFSLPAIPAGSVIVGIQVLVEGSGASSRDVLVDLSWNAGTTFTGGDPTVDVVAVEQVFTVGGTTNTWGRTWAVGDFTAANFRVRLTADNDSGDVLVDHVQVNVHYLTPTTTAVTSSLNPSNLGDSVTFTATVTSASGTPTGSVTFQDGGTPIGSGVLDAGGVATFSTTTLTAGSHNITAVYSGDTNYGGSTSAMLVQNVSGPPTILSANNTSFTVLTAGTTFSVIASGYPAPTFILSGDTLPGGVSFDSNTGLFSGTPATNTAGAYNLVITATNGINPDATQNFTLTVAKRNQTITFNAPATAAYGTTFNVTPTASSGLLVTIASSGGCTNVGFAVTMTSSTVPCALTASQAGNIDYNPAPNVSDTVTAGRAATSVTITSSANPSVLGQNVIFTVRVTSAGGTPTGTVTLSRCLRVFGFCIGGTTVIGTEPLVGGIATFNVDDLPVLRYGGVIVPHSITATYNGDVNFNGSSTNLDQTVSTANTITSLTSSINPSYFTQSVTFTATVIVAAPGAGQVGGGTMTFFDGAVSLGTGTVNASGVATFTTTTLAMGSHNITAYFQGTNDFGTSTSPILVQIVRRPITIGLTSSLNPSTYGGSVTFTATVAPVSGGGTPSGTVTFYDGAAPISAPITMAGGVATFSTSALEVVVGGHDITAVYSGDTTFVPGTSAILVQMVNPATLTVTGNNQTIVYGDANPFLDATITGFVNGETLGTSDVTGSPLCSTTATPTSPVSGSPYPITCTVGTLASSNYVFNYVDGELTITQKPLTITASSFSKVYGNLYTFTGTEFVPIGLINADTVTSVTLTSAGAPAAAVAGSYPIVPSLAVGTGLSNYAITYVNGTMIVNANALTIYANDQTKVYGDTFTFTGNEFTVVGLQTGDSVTSVTFTSLGAPSDADVGTYLIVPSAAVGVNLGSYAISYNNGLMDVNQRDLTFNPASQTKVYGDVFTAYTGTFTGLRVGDNITPVYDSLGAPATAAVATYDITVTLDDPDGKLGNYSNITIDPAPSATLTVTPKALTITASNQSKPYGTLFTFAGTEFTTTALSNGDTVDSVTLTSTGAPATALASPPTYPIISSAAVGSGLSNYTITYVNGAMTVTKPNLLVTSDSQTKIYGDVFTAFTGSIVGIQNGDNITATYSSAGGPANAPFGTYPITITLNDPDGKLVNYNQIPPNVGTLSVTRRDLTVVANDMTKIYGDPITLTGTVTGVQAGDNITFTYSSQGTALTAPVGSYSIAITMNDPLNRISNYNFTLTPATLTVTLRDLVVAPDNQSKQYGTWFFAFTGTITGIHNGDNITANYASTGSLPSAAVGPHPITTTLNDPTGKLGNYNVIINPATLTVGSSVLTITAENKTIFYGDPEPAFTFTYFGFAAGDTPAVVDTPPTCTVVGPHTDFGTYPIVCSGGVDNAYTFVYVPGTLTVNKRPLVVTPTDKTKLYGDLFTLFTGSITGVQAGDNITVTYASTGAVATAPIGDYDITAALSDPGNKLPNYVVTSNIGTLSVLPRALTVTPADKTKIYGDVFAAFTGTITGIQNGDPITATYASPGSVATAPIGNHTITATLIDPTNVLGNYTVIRNTGTLTVTLRPLVVTPDNKAKVFGTVFNAFTGSVTGILAADNITVTYASTGSPAAAAVGTYPITAALTDPNNRLSNYAVTLNTGTLTVGVNVLTVTANNQTMVYGNVDPAFTFTYAGFQPGDTPAVLTTLPTCQVSVAHNAIGTYPITCSGGVDDNYIFSYVPATLTVTPRALTVTPDNKSKIYGDIFTAYTGTSTGIQAADNITITYASLGAAATAVVGPYPITVTLNDPNNRLSNYTQTINTGILTVTQRPLVVTPDDKNKVYGTVFTAFTGSVVGVQGSDNITPTYASTGAPAAAASGTYPITATLNDPNNRLSNYAVTLNTGTLTVGGNTLVVTPADKTKVYGSTFAAFTGTIVGLQPGDNITATYSSTGAAANAIIGDYDITVTLNDPGNKLPNYTVILNIGTLTVTPRDLIVTPDNKAKAFGTNFTAFTGTLVGLQAGDIITPTYASTGAPAAAAAGIYPITVTLADPGNRLTNYNVTLNTGTLTVGTNVLTVTANNQTMVYGNPDPAFTFTYSGFLGADTPAVLDTPPTCQVSVPHNAVGTYPISCSGGIDNNYVFSYTPGTLTVTSRALAVTPANKTKVYGDTFTAFTGAAVGLQAADNITVTYNSTGAPAIAAVGSYSITATLDDPLNRLSNYTVTLNTGTLTITQRPLVVTPDNKNKVYGTLFTAFTGSITGIQNGDAITPVYASAGAPAAAAGGTYPITVTLNGLPAVLANYAITLNTGTLTVGGNTLVVTPADKTKVYGSTFAAFTGTIVGLQPGDNITATYSSVGAAANAIIGDHTITVTLNDPGNKLPNYTVTLNTGTLSVTPRSLLVVPDNKTKLAGTLFTAFTGTVTGVQTGDNITPTYASPGAPAAAAAGVYPITATLNDPANRLPNYTVTISNTATLSVSLTNQTITITTLAPITAANNSTFTVAATASSGLPVTYSTNTPAVCSNNGATFTMLSSTGTCIVHYNQAGNGSYNPAPELIEAVSALANGQTITVTTSAPALTSPGSSFPVQATSSSGLTVSITVTGSCTRVLDPGVPGKATVTMGNTSLQTCDIHYNQAGNATYASAPEVVETTTVDSNAPTVTANQEAAQVDPTNASPINFTVLFSEPMTGFDNTDVTIGGTAGATTAVVTEIAPNNGTTYVVAVSGMTGDGTVTISIPAGAATDAAGNNNQASTSTDNSVTYLDGIGPNVQALNTTPETKDHVLSSAEVVKFNITQLKVQFNQDVYNPAGDSDPDDVTNPNNYILIRDLGDTAGVQTVSCVAGADVPADTSIAIGTVTYDSETYIATFSINSGLPLSNGDYHLFVCGTTSIVDPLNNALALVGSAGLPGTDFRGSFTVNITANGGGGGAGGGGGTGTARPAVGALIPVTGLDPNQVTILSKQPADKAYKALDDIWIEIPTLGISYPIVGVSLSRSSWNLTWLKDGVGYLEGSAYPTFNGNSVLTAHINDANKNAGPFSDIKGMQLGDKIFIHAYGKVYVYEVQENIKILPNDISTAFKHQEYAWITLVTCEDYNAKIEEYHNRRMVRAILVSVVPKE